MFKNYFKVFCNNYFEKGRVTKEGSEQRNHKGWVTNERRWIENCSQKPLKLKIN